MSKLIEVRGNIWDFYNKGEWICITTNGIVKANGELVMGKGIALEASKMHPKLAKYWGMLIKDGGNRVYPATHIRMFSFPTKDDWRDVSKLDIIRKSIIELRGYLNTMIFAQIYIPRPGCGLGGLDWDEEVKPALESMINPPDDRFIFVSK